jgi:ABC-2 type transport system ATP-binding protein
MKNRKGGTMSFPAAIEVHGLKKTYSERPAVDGIDFAVRPGEIFSLLGPNGAGKTTTIGMISGCIPPDGGDARLMGVSMTGEPRQAKRLLGVVPQEIAVYEDLSAKENLAFWGRLYGLSGRRLANRVRATLDLVGLTDRQNERSGRYSGGMKRRLNIAVALLHEPPVMILDEPTVGIDPQSRRRILDGVKALRDQGTAVLYTTHYMEEAEELSDRIAVMDRGRLIAQGTYADLIRKVGESQRISLSVSGASEALLGAWRGLPGVEQADRADGTATILARDAARVLPGLFEAAARTGTVVSSVDVQSPNLESVFLFLTGRALRD